MAEPATSESSPDTDRDFDPTADMLVHEFDDEHTLDEEEAMSGDTSCSDELDKLEKEQDMPIEQLLALYGYGAAPGDDYGGEPVNPELHESRSSSEEEILSNQDLTLDKEVIARDLLKDEDHDRETSVNDLLDSVDMPSHTVRLLRSNSQAGSSDDDESADEDYQPEKDDDWKKVIQVGSDFQAAVPEGLCKYGDAPAYENEDRLLWDPTRLTDETVEKFLQEVHTQGHQGAQGVQAIPTGAHIRDDEQALYLLLQCGHNVEEAVRRRKMQAVPPTDPMSLWSEEECRNFENGLRTYGKDFHLIQQNKVRTRSVGELVQFYYLWKKTERHDMFANKTRLEKKKYILHPGVTDYMDRFLDDQENPAPVRDRSSSPNINSLIYGDPKRQNSPHKIYEDGLHATSDSNTMFSPIKLNPELNTALPTTVSINAELRQGQQQSAENIVHIANFAPTTAPAVSNSTESSWIESEPSPKRLKTECDEKTVLDNSAPSLLCTGTGDNAVSAEAEESNSDSNHVGNVALSISSVNSVHSIGDNNLSSIASESSAMATAQSMAQ